MQDDNYQGKLNVREFYYVWISSAFVKQWSNNCKQKSAVSKYDFAIFDAVYRCFHFLVAVHIEQKCFSVSDLDSNFPAVWSDAGFPNGFSRGLIHHGDMKKIGLKFLHAFTGGNG